MWNKNTSISLTGLHTSDRLSCVFFHQRAGAGAAGRAVGDCRTGGLAGFRRHHGLQPLAPSTPQQPGHPPLRGDGGGWVLCSVARHIHLLPTLCDPDAPLYVSPDRSLSAGWIGLVGRRGPRSKQPFMVTFFRENQVPCRPPRAVKPHPRKKKPKYDLPVPSIHSKVPHFMKNVEILKNDPLIGFILI